MEQRLQSGIAELTERLIRSQSADGSWRMGFIESGTSVDAAAIMLLQTAGLNRGKLVKALAERLLAKQGSDGAWRVYPDERDGNASATAEAYYALQLAGLSANEPGLVRAKTAFAEIGGMKRINSLLAKFHLALLGCYPWPRWFPVPLALLLLPDSSPVHFFQFSGYARVHIAPMLLLADRKPKRKSSGLHPLTAMKRSDDDMKTLMHSWQDHFASPLRALRTDYRLRDSGNGGLGAAGGIRAKASRRAERYMLDRLEPDGTLYSYSSATLLMIHALRALGYGNRHPVLVHALQGLESLVFADERCGAKPTLQITTSALWDTALLGHALLAAGSPEGAAAARQAAGYLLPRQHTKLGDWKRNVHSPLPGGWGFSAVNTINPDVDDTTAALRTIRLLPGAEAAQASERGLQWLIGMQNPDGGWAAFERNIDNPLIRWVPLDGAKDAATDPSTPDLTGRTLEYLGNCAGLTGSLGFIRRAADWLYRHQEKNGSWYGRWGVCYIYGTWAALTGLAAVREPLDHPRVRAAVEWLLGIQLSDGGFGESCASDGVKRFVPLSYGTLSQTAWALDALTAVLDEPLPAMERACDFLLRHSALAPDSPSASYPTGAGLPGCLYTRYDSYSLVWPLLALAHYRGKYFPNARGNKQ